MQDTSNLPKIVVVGGGFAGIAVLKKLQRSNTKAQITLISKNDHFEYFPALYKLVTGSLPIEVSVPLSVIFPKPTHIFHAGTFNKLNQESQTITTIDDSGHEHTLPYDYLVLALGSETNYFNIKGLPEHSFSFKSVEAALKLKGHFCNIFSMVKNLSKEELVSMLHVVIVGAGPSGVELGGDLRSYLTKLAKHYHVDPNLVTIDLIESNSRVLPMMSPKISRIAEARLRKMGVNIFKNRTLASQEVEEVFLKDMQMKSHTVIWTAGTRINQTFNNIPGIVLDEHKRVIVSTHLSLPNDNHIFIAGDGASTPYSGLAQTAIHNGEYIGKYIANSIKGKKNRPYKPKAPSYVIPIGNYWAMLIHNNFVFRGFLSWLLRSAVDFRYFFQTVPLYYVFAVFLKGIKYRRLHGGCEIGVGPKSIN